MPYTLLTRPTESALESNPNVIDCWTARPQVYRSVQAAHKAAEKAKNSHIDTAVVPISGWLNS